MLRGGGGGQRWAPELSIAAALNLMYLEFRELIGMTVQAALARVPANSVKQQKDFQSVLESLCVNTRY